MKFQLISDLHLEFYKRFELVPHIEKHASNLIVAGDLGKPFSPIFKEWINWASSKWDNVYYVAGNHEYYNHRKHYDKINLELESIDIPNFHFLNRRIIQINDNLAIAGCTLWSHITNPTIQFRMNDYNKIRKKIKIPFKDRILEQVHTIDKNVTNNFHKEDKEWIINNVLPLKCDVIMITHHAPLYDGIAPSGYEGSVINQAYGTNMTDIIEGSPIKYWCYGHCHCKREFILNNGNTKVISNAYGYPDEKTGYEFDCTIKV